jgi:hypothetical protein
MATCRWQRDTATVDNWPWTITADPEIPLLRILRDTPGLKGPGTIAVSAAAVSVGVVTPAFCVLLPD